MAPSTDTRQKLIETAMRLFHEQGYAATGIATILREADVNAGSLYHFFASKEELLLGVLEHYEELLHPVILQPAEEATADGVERVFVLLRNYRKGLEMTSCRLGCPIGNLALELSDTYPAVREKIDANFRNWMAGIAGWLGAERDRFEAGVDLDGIASFVLTVMEGAMMQCRTRNSLTPFDEALELLRRTFDSLLKDGAAKPSR